MKRKILYLIIAGFICTAFQFYAAAQDTPKKLFDLIPEVPKSYEETLEPDRCNKFTQFKEGIETAFKTITTELQELHPKVQAAMMSNPMIFASESLLNLMQYAGHEYFIELSEELPPLIANVEEKKRALMEELREIQEKVYKKHDCGKFPEGSAQSEACEDAYRQDLFREEVKAYNEYLTSVEPDLNQFHEKLRRFIMYIHNNITAIPDQTNEAVRFHILGAKQASNTFMVDFAMLIDIHCAYPEFIHEPE